MSAAPTGPLFRQGGVRGAAGGWLPWKVECDALGAEDWAWAAKVVTQNLLFSEIEGVPTGGTPFAEALAPYCGRDGGLLIVDDVLTTGTSMEAQRAGRPALGAVLFARGRCPDWVWPIWQFTPPARKARVRK